MGRVYKALVRAERWGDRDRGIGSPSGDDDSGSARVASFEFDGDLALSEETHSSASGEMFGLRPLVSVSESYVAQEIASTMPRRSLASVVTPPVFEEPDEVVSVSELTVDPHLPVLTDGDSLAAERFRTLAARILNMTVRRKLKTLLITSAEAGEGKSTVATSVAWCLAKHPERRVLLIDASLASLSICRSLGVEEKRGWVDLIDRSCEPKQAIVRFDPNRLYVLSPGRVAGTVEADAYETRLEDVITEMAPRFDLVIVDSPAILESLETQSLAGMLDGSVIVARAGYTHHRKVTAASKLIPKERRLGVVLNETDIDVHQGYKGSFAGSLFGHTKRRVRGTRQRGQLS